MFSRTQDLEYEFCNVLESVDKLALLDIYAAREEPISGVSSINLLKKIDLINKWHVDFDTIEDILKREVPRLVVTAGAGDVYKLMPKIKSILI